MHHDAAHDEEEAEHGAMGALEESGDMQYPAEAADGGDGGDPEEIEADAEQDGIEYSGNEDPLPELMFGDEMVGLGIRLEGYNDFFEQVVLFTFFCLLGGYLGVKRTYLWRTHKSGRVLRGARVMLRGGRRHCG